jgi:hypothetical protein
MKIDRPELMAAFMTFASEGNGLVIGHPGIGKTHTLIALRETLKKEKINHLIVPVESLGEAAPTDIKAFLGRDGDLIQLLQQTAKGTKSPSILMFDGFDATRGEKERTAVLRLIKRAISELAGYWNVIVSVRKFDAAKSHSLLDLFPDSEGGPTARTRQFTVPLLERSELEQAFSQIANLRAIWENGRPELKELLRVPFNIWLVEKIGLEVDNAEFSKITSEVQLLDLYWDYRVRRAADFEQRNQVLTHVTRAMVAQHTLSVRKDEVYRPELNTAWDELFSAEILSSSPKNIQRIGFAHNILFDFAVSSQLLENDPKQLAGFIAEDPARPLFLRPSLVYHFTHLWHTSRETFWENFWSILNRTELHLHQIVRLVLPTIVVNEATVQADLEPLLGEVRTGKPDALKAMTFLMQALRVLKTSRTDLWASFIADASECLAAEFAWEAGSNVIQFLGDRGNLPSLSKEKCGIYGRNLLAWTRSPDRKEDKTWLGRLSAYIAIPIVGKTFDTNPPESRKLLNPILELVGTPDFPIEAVHRLIDELPFFIDADPQFVTKIYLRVFGFQESSDRKTNMGGFVLPLISNRRQDYDMCRYSLLEFFPQFLAKQPVQAAFAGLEAVQNFAIEDHILPYQKGEVDFAQAAEHFAFRGRQASFIRDASAIWDEQFHHDQEMQLANHVFGWLSRCAEGSKLNEIDRVLDFMADKVFVAVLWSRLLSVAAAYPKIFADLLFELLLAKPILASADLRTSCQRFLTKVFPLLPAERRSLVESAIQRLPDNEDDANSRQWLEAKRERLQSAIGKTTAPTSSSPSQTEDLSEEEILESSDDIFSVTSGFEQWTEEDEIKRRGIDLQNPDNAWVRDATLPFQNWANKGKDSAAVPLLFENARNLRHAVTANADASLLADAWYHLVDFSIAALQSINPNESEDFKFFRDLVLEGSSRPEPVADPEVDRKWTSPIWTPSARNSAAQILPWLTSCEPNQEVLAAVKRLATDPVPSVRFLLFSEIAFLHKTYPDDLYALLYQAIDTETNRTVWQGIAVSLWKLRWRENARTQELVQKVLSKWLDEADDDDWNAKAQVVGIVVDYAVDGIAWAVAQVQTWGNGAFEDPGAAAVSGNRLSQYIKPKASESKLAQARTLLIAQLISISSALQKLQQSSESVSSDQRDKKLKKLYGVIDQTVSRIYFALDVNPSLRREEGRIDDDEVRKQFFKDSLPILDTVLSFGEQQQNGILLAPTAHYFMQLLNGVVRFDPNGVLDRAAKVVRFASRFSFNLDSLALTDTVRLVETMLTDYPEELREGRSLTNLLEILDAFTKVGWPDALNLVWRLDEIYR